MKITLGRKNFTQRYSHNGGCRILWRYKSCYRPDSNIPTCPYSIIYHVMCMV